MIEEHSLIEEPDFHRLVLSVSQQVYVPWLLATVLTMFPTFFASILFQPLVIPGIAMFISVFVLAFGGAAFKPRAQIALQPNKLAIDGWTGVLPTRHQHEVGIEGVVMSWKRGAIVNDIQLFSVRFLLPDGHTIRLPSIRCTEAELVTIRKRLQGYQMLSELEPEPEAMPGELRQMMQAERQRMSEG